MRELKGLIVKFKSVRALVMNIGFKSFELIFGGGGGIEELEADFEDA